MKYILVGSGDNEAVSAIRACLGSEYEIETAEDRDKCLEKFSRKRCEFLFIDISFLEAESRHEEGFDYADAFNPFWNVFPTVQIIVMCSQADIRKAVDAVKAGASDYISYPVNADEVRLVYENSQKAMMMQHELEYLRDRFWKSEALKIIHTLNPSMKNVFDKVKSVAPTRTTVLLTGETGTGKGVIAKLIHLHSNRCDNQFISVHCGAIPDTLIESELFGHEKGAFTGAIRRKPGKFEIAKGGTIFLDEIGTITQSAQIKLLQILQDKCFQRVGGETVIESDVRVIAASNEDLQELIKEGRFRKDLYYRLNVFPIIVPPLRDRTEDIPFLVQSFLDDLNKRYSRKIKEVHPRVMEAFKSYEWPGNIRELENIIERAYIIEPSKMLTPSSIPAEILGTSVKAEMLMDTSKPLADARKISVENMEKEYLRKKLSEHKGRIDAAAKSAGIGTRQLHKLMKKYKLDKKEFKTP